MNNNRAARKKGIISKLILVCVLAVLVLMTFIGTESIDSLALEQQVRCGMAQHTHTKECYIDGVLICDQHAHVHSNNCYMVLLSDNDINWLLSVMEKTENKSLEGVLDSAMGQALSLNENFQDSTPPISLSAEDISSLNETIRENGIEPPVVLNENLLADSVLSYTPANNSSVAPPYEVSSQSTGGGQSGYAIGDRPSTNTRAANFYIMLDGRITFIGSGNLSNSNPDYYSYSNIVSKYSSVVTTELTTRNINNSYYFRYNTDGDVSSVTYFDTNASYSNNRVRFGNVSSARYVLLCQRSGNSSYQAVPFYTVTLDYSRSGADRENETEYVEEGASSGLSLSDEFLWCDSAGNMVTTIPGSINATTTLYAMPKAYTVKFENRNGTEITAPYTQQPVNGTVEVPLPDLRGTSYEGWYWVEKDSDGQTYYLSDGSSTAIVTGSTTFVTVPSSYNIEFFDENGQKTVIQADYLERIMFGELPEGWGWIDEDGNRYEGGSLSAPVTEDKTFTAATRVMNVNYNVNFPQGAVSSVDSVPTIYGTDSLTITDLAVGGKSIVVRDLTSRIARREVSSGNKESVTYYFNGWTVDGYDVLIPPDSTLSWNDLLKYEGDDGEVHLKGVWDEGSRLNSATFFVRFDSAAVDVNGNITSQPSENYTPEVFNTHVGGIDLNMSESELKKTYEIADTTADNSYTADQAIRALYGERSDGMWLYDFPSDDYIFSYLKDYLERNPGKQLTYDGEPVIPSQLNHDYYAIRWYVCKLEGSSWHIDGKVYRKEGSVTIDKTFGGDDHALNVEKGGFYILAENGVLDENGTFVAYDPEHSKFKEYLLVVNQTGADMLHQRYPHAEILIFDSETDSGHHYEWVIDGVELNEYWHIEEFPIDIPDYSYYAEYSVYDTDGYYSAIAEYGTRASMIGKTFALDEDPDQGLMVDFRNYYYKKETILIKKEDAKTGRPIGGAVFELWQNDNKLSFNFNEETGQYERDESGDGEFSQIVTADDGFSIISTTGFSYEYGDVVVKEVLPPDGYDPAPDITVGLDEEGNVVLKDIADKPPDEWHDIAEVPVADVLVVKDHAAEFVSVTVEKVWNTNTPADSVEIVLQANGQHAAALFPGMTNAQVVLNAGDSWTSTWTDLPRYANGKIVEWGVKEVLIGGKPTLSDGVTFANWTVTYSPGRGTDKDDDGDIDSWKFTVTNSTRRSQLILTKVGSDGNILPGSIFSLEQVEFADGAWRPIEGLAVNTQTTDANGMLTFDNLVADVYYRLTELQATGGYFVAFDPVVITIDGAGNIRRMLDDGTAAQLDDPLVKITGPYNIRIVNLKVTSLPQTGGIGTHVYIMGGAVLMIIASVALLIYIKKRRKEGKDTS